MNLEDEFTKALDGTVEAAKAKNYNPTFFIRMLAEHGGVETARRLLAHRDPQTGLFELYHRSLLHESMEAVVLQDKFRSLFTEKELVEARRRLEELGYYP
jgi:recombinational DNA repair protein (RecF pathway)